MKTSMTSIEFIRRCHKIDPRRLKAIDGMPIEVVGGMVYVEVDAGVMLKLDEYLRQEGMID